MTSGRSASLSPSDVEARRDWFRRHWQSNIAFNRHCGITVQEWGPDGVDLVVAYADTLAAHPGVMHGGVLATLVDTTGTAAVIAGHDFANGSRITTSTMSLQYLAPARGDVVAHGHCLRRGRLLHVAAVEVRDGDGTLGATGQVTATVAGERPGLLGPLPGDEADRDVDPTGKW